MPPALATTLPPRPGIRIFSPLRSAGLLIFFRNHPAICGPVEGPGRGTRLNALYVSSQSFSPSPWRYQPIMPSGFIPKGTAENHWTAGSLPAQ